MSRILAFIPARSESKRLPNKNILDFAGKPLIHRTIEAALKCDVEMDVIVSTDCQDIAKIARQAGAEVPFLRPASLASDTSTSFDALEHALGELSLQDRHYEYVLFLQPTSPLRQPHHIEEAIASLESNQSDCVISVTKVSHPVEWIMNLTSSLSMDEFIKKNQETLKKRSQDLSEHYQLNGAIYYGKISLILEQKTFFLTSGNVFGYEMDKKDSVDIDEIDDFQYAEFLYRQRT